MAFATFISKVDKLKTIEGCELFIPLPETLTEDYRQVMQILDCMQIPDDPEHRIIWTDEKEDVTKKNLQSSLLVIIKKARECREKGMILQLFVYFSGHGAGHDQK